MINWDKIVADDNLDESYVIPVLLPPGKNDLLIRTPKDQKVQSQLDSGSQVDFEDYHNSDDESDATFRWYYHRNMSNIREEKVPPYKK